MLYFKFEAYAATQLQVNGSTNSFVFVVDGPLPVRQVLHPEALKKAIQLPRHYWTYFDIKREYRRLFNNNENLNTLQDILTSTYTMNYSNRSDVGVFWYESVTYRKTTYLQYSIPYSASALVLMFKYLKIGVVAAPQAYSKLARRLLLSF